MSRKKIYIVIVLAVISLLGIAILQIYWVKKAYNLEEKQFNDRVTIAMTTVVKKVLQANQDSSFVEPVEQVSPNFFVANINDTLYPYLLESLLREEFVKSNITEELEYGIYDCFSDSIIFGSKLNFHDSLSTKIEPRTDISIQKYFNRDGHYFGVYFPKKSNILLKNMDFWIFTSMLILIVVIFFSYTIIAMLQQKKLSEVKSDFINNMTHELKTPISTISISAEKLMKKTMADNPEKLLQYATIIKNENDRLKNQVEKVLQLATFSKDKLKVSQKRLDIHDIIRKAIESFQIRSDETANCFQLDLKAKSHDVQGDKVHLTNIFYNLIDNACKYHKNKTEVTIKSHNKNNKLIIEVIDRGIGIDKKYHRAIFDKFFRVSTGNIHDVKGFGLGLYYVKTVVEAHQGSIQVKSELDKGSTFTVTLKTIKKHHG